MSYSESKEKLKGGSSDKKTTSYKKIAILIGTILVLSFSERPFEFFQNLNIKERVSRFVSGFALLRFFIRQEGIEDPLHEEGL